MKGLRFKRLLTFAMAAVVAATSVPLGSSKVQAAGRNVVVENTKATINGKEKTGKMITFNFKPYTFKEATFEISQVVVMYDGDHFMRKFLEISIDDAHKTTTAIDYIDLESLVVDEEDKQWTIPKVGGIVQMTQFRASLGQTIYIQGMFLGCGFPETDTQIVNFQKQKFVLWIPM